MPKLWNIVQEHFEEDFDRKVYAGLALFLSAFILLNYTIELEDSIIDHRENRYSRILFYLLLYSTGYYFTCGLIAWTNTTFRPWKNQNFWILSLVGLCILSLDKGFPYSHWLIHSFNNPYNLYFFLHQVVDHASTFIWIFIPLLAIYRWIDTTNSHFYGLCKTSAIKSYWILIVVMLPVIGLAVLQSDFIQFYPMYKASGVEAIYNWPAWIPAFIYEFFYGLSFINVELLFRGFFVIGMSQVLGRHAILPMVTIYCFLHFGKPAGECMSSIFGGYVLGILAFRTQSIWGGIIVHIAIAWLMEATAYWLKV